MRINHKILSIPPFISTSWSNISSLHVESRDSQLVLIIDLVQGSQIEIPNLEGSVIEAVFAAHAKYLEEESAVPQLQATGGAPVSFAFGLEGVEGMDGLGGLLQHNAEQANSDPLPEEVLSKIGSISKAMGIDAAHSLPKAEPHCNCPHCQISRAMHGEKQERAENLIPPPPEEDVSEEDLKFRVWDIAQTEGDLYTLTNPLDAKEHYNVYLGDPIGCTCGEKNCEHIRAVLNS
jgi:hypothetical protein